MHSVFLVKSGVTQGRAGELTCVGEDDLVSAESEGAAAVQGAAVGTAGGATGAGGP
jgi:hypothetical protein